MSWSALIRDATSTLASAGVDSPAADARILAAHVAGENLILAPEPSAAMVETFTELVARRAKRIPLQHLTGTMYFRYLELPATPGVFIVRPETELLAGWAIDEARELSSPTVVDLCTGSGAIALSIATEAPNSRVWAVERDPFAFEAAKRHCGEHVRVVHGDALDSLEELAGDVDILVSNPPYVPPSEVSLEARHDPDLALWGGGEDGTEIPRKIITRAANLLAPGGLFLMEHDPSQAETLRQACEDAGLVEVSTLNDLTGRPRFCRARQAL